MTKIVHGSFTSGELAPSLHARVDLSKYTSGLKTCKNFMIHAHGGVSNRAGSKFIAEVKDSSKATILLPFEFNNEDAYALEFGDQYMRVYRNGGQVVESDKTITGATNANPVSLLVTGHGYTTGEEVYVSSVGGMTEINGRSLKITVTDANNYTLDGVDGTAYGTYTSGGVSNKVYELATPYLEADVTEIRTTQSADVITICHPSYQPRNLSRTGHTSWSLDVIAFEPEIEPPTGLSATQTVGNGTTERAYVVTSANTETTEESVASAEVSILTDLDDDWVDGEYVDISWTAATGADTYNVYKKRSGLYGYVGSAEGTTFRDDKILPDMTDTPPVARNPFDGAGNYPSLSSYYQQRQVFAASNNKVNTIWFSRTGNFRNFSVSAPLKADDAMTLTINSNQVNVVQSILTMDELIVLTSGAEHKISSGDAAFSIENVKIKPQGYRGASSIQPLVIGNTALYVQANGGVVRDMAYALETDSYSGNDISVMSAHLFEGRYVTSWTYAQDPHSIVWAVLDNGQLLGLTYMREHQVWGWHHHETDGEYTSVISIPEDRQDVVYTLVTRTIDSETKQYVERFVSRIQGDVEDSFFVDSGLTYEGSPVAALSGLDHLEGATVAILADGNVHPQTTVANGSISLDYEASKIHVGLPYTAEIQTLEPHVVLDKYSGSSLSKTKTVSRLTVRVLKSRGLWAGSTSEDLIELKQRTDEAWGDPIALFTGDFELTVEPTWQEHGSVIIQQRDPLPATILAVIPDLDTGG
ncbi:MAG: hypothetical protein GY753_09815 [Gammaproteobacteria bacterium]|nr:hypothetical protein [Gammaproteobacteria bacterium]